MILGYISTSTKHQNTDKQLDGVKVDEFFVDKSSGKTNNRPKLKKLIDYSHKGDTVVCHQIDRMARSLTDLLWIVETLVEKGVTVKFYKENLTFSADSQDTVSLLMLHMLSAVAQFERSIVYSRIKKAQELGKRYKGRKRSVSKYTVQRILSLKKKGNGVFDICKELGLSKTTIYRYLADPVNGGCKNPFRE